MVNLKLIKNPDPMGETVKKMKKQIEDCILENGVWVYKISADKPKRSYSELGGIIVTSFLNFAFAFYFVMVFTCYLMQAYIHEERLAFNGDLLNVGAYSFLFFVLRMLRSRGVFWTSYFFWKIVFVLSSPFILSGIFNPEYLDVAGMAIAMSWMLGGFFYIIFTFTYCLKYGSEILDKDREEFNKFTEDRLKKLK